MSKKAFELWCSGEGSVTCLDDAIDHWHDFGEGNESLREYLGMSSDQYVLFMKGMTQFEAVYPYGGARVN